MSAPKSYKIRFIEPGLISYEDQEAGTVLVEKSALDRMAATFKGCPVIFVPEHHNDADKSTAFNFDDVGANPPSGIVSGMPYWGDDGWQWVDVLIWDEAAQEAIAKGFNASCAYIVDEEGEGGERNGLAYNAEITNGHYIHMAIVPRPRYNEAMILANSKGGHPVAINLFRKNAAPPVPPKKPEAAPAAPAHPEPDADNKPQMLNDDTEVDVKGIPVPLHELRTAYQEKHGISGAMSIDPDTPVTLDDGSQVTIADLITDYDSGDAGEPDADNLMQNAEDPTSVPAAPVVDESKQGSVRTNSAPVKRTVNMALRNAAAQPGETADDDHPETRTERLDRGASRYSKAVAQGGK
jgi:hypothetical protein